VFFSDIVYATFESLGEERREGKDFLSRRARIQVLIPFILDDYFL
jgi:hypothetical protein